MVMWVQLHCRTAGEGALVRTAWGIGVEYFQGYGSQFLLRRCQWPEHPKMSPKTPFIFHNFGQAMSKWLLGDIKLNITKTPDPEILMPADSQWASTVHMIAALECLAGLSALDWSGNLGMGALATTASWDAPAYWRSFVLEWAAVACLAWALGRLAHLEVHLNILPGFFLD